ncbi:MAG: TMEM14 family protein [Ignavibacteria bacterium]
MRLTGTIILIYGIITLAGGIFGYVKAQSTASLIAGGIFGIILIADAFMIYKNNFIGIYAAIIISLILGIMFGLRFSKNPNLMPAGIMLVMSLIALGFAVYALSQKNSIKP